MRLKKKSLNKENTKGDKINKLKSTVCIADTIMQNPYTFCVP